MHREQPFKVQLTLSVLAGVLLIGGCNRSPPPDMSIGKQQNSDVESAPAPPVFAPLPAKPVLKSLPADEFVWGDPDHPDSRQVRVLFDNGTESDLRIKLADDVELSIPHRQRRTLFTHVGPIKFRACDPELPEGEAINAVAEAGDLCVYNHRSAWDYDYAEHGYSTIPGFGGSNPGRVGLVGPVFFRARDVDYLFEPAPQSVTVVTYGGYGGTTKRSLDHMGTEPTPGRAVRRLVLKGQEPLHLVTDTERSIHIHRLGDKANEARRTLHIDNAAAGDATRVLSIALEGAALAELPADEILRLSLPAGKFALTATNADATVVEARAIEPEHAGRYVWCPEGRRAYTIDYKIYSISSFGFGNHGPKERAPVTCRGLRFFRCEAPLMFQEFPTTYSMSVNQWEARVARLSQGDAGDSRDALSNAWTALQVRAMNELKPDVQARFQRETALAQGEPPTDCDLWLAEAWLAFERADDETVVQKLDDLLAFRPERALAHKLYGLSAARLGRNYEALDHLRIAVGKDDTLSAELTPKIDELETAREREAEKQRAEEQQKAEQSPGTESPR